MNRHRWAVIAGALLLAAIVGGIAYNAGVAHGLQQSGKVLTAPPYPYYAWHPFFFGPFFFFVLFVLVMRGLFWRGYWHRHACGGYGGYRERLEQWHREAHERMKDA